MDGDDGGFCRDMLVYIWEKFPWYQSNGDVVSSKDDADGRKWNNSKPTFSSNTSRRSGSFSMVDDRSSQTSKSQDDLTGLFRWIQILI